MVDKAERLIAQAKALDAGFRELVDKLAQRLPADPRIRMGTYRLWRVYERATTQSRVLTLLIRSFQLLVIMISRRRRQSSCVVGGLGQPYQIITLHVRSAHARLERD